MDFFQMLFVFIMCFLSFIVCYTVFSLTYGILDKGKTKLFSISLELSPGEIKINFLLGVGTVVWYKVQKFGIRLWRWGRGKW